jgi:DNA-binding PadR family transcriptional regulator
MIETKETEEHQGKLRKIYRITEKGKIEFDKWLSTPALPIITRHEAYLKIWLASNDIEKIRIQLQQIHDYSKNILQLMDSANMEKFTNYVKWMMDVGKKHVALDVEWSESCLAKLAEIEKKDKHHD